MNMDELNDDYEKGSVLNDSMTNHKKLYDQAIN